MPKGRYNIMRAYMPKVGGLGLDMMLRTCTVQANLDFASEADMVAKFRTQPGPAADRHRPVRQFAVHRGQAQRLPVRRAPTSGPTPILTAPACWTSCSRTASASRRYARYALDVPMYFVKRGGRYIDLAGRSFRDFMDGKLADLPGERPTDRRTGPTT